MTDVSKASRFIPSSIDPHSGGLHAIVLVADLLAGSGTRTGEGSKIEEEKGGRARPRARGRRKKTTIREPAVAPQIFMLDRAR
jgi:hypothetical protein